MIRDVVRRPSPVVPSDRTAPEVGLELAAVVVVVWLVPPECEPPVVVAAATVTRKSFVDVHPGISVPVGMAVIASSVTLSFA